ncbi:MAG: acyltransferase [Lachnospiraceae bacterium]|nr:acyltransferase [Lachnospiraceae bacterium]
MDYLMLIYPLIVLVILLAGCKVKKKGEFEELAWSISQSRDMQAAAALMIIIHHTVQAITFYGNTYKGPITVWSSFGIYFTSIFFFFSGFGLYKSITQKENYLDGFFSRRLPRIVIPFMLINLIFLFIVPAGRITKIRHVFTSILGLTLLNTNTWFIVELVILYIAFYIAFRKSAAESAALRKIFLFTMALVIFSLLLGHDGSEINGHWFMGEWWYNTTLIFVMGLYFSKYEKSIKAFAEKHYKILLSVMTVLLIITFIAEEIIRLTFGFYSETVNNPGYGDKLLTMVSQTLTCAVFMCVLLLINMKIRFNNRALVFLGGISFEIFLIHDAFVELLPGGLEGTMPDMEYIGLTMVLGVLSGWILSIADKYLVGYFGDGSVPFFSMKRPIIPEDVPDEAARKIRRKRIVMTAVKVFYLAVFIGVIVTECMAWFF